MTGADNRKNSFHLLVVTALAICHESSFSN